LRKDRQGFIVQKINPNSCGTGHQREDAGAAETQTKNHDDRVSKQLLEFRFKATRLEEFDSLWFVTCESGSS